MGKDTDMRVLRVLLQRPDQSLTVSDLSILTRRGKRSVQRSLRKLQGLGLAGCHGRLWRWNPQSLVRTYAEKARPRIELLQNSEPVSHNLDLGLVSHFLRDPHGWWTAAECVLVTSRPITTVRKTLARLGDATILIRDPGRPGKNSARYKLNPSLSTALSGERARLIKAFKEWNYE